MWLKSCIYLFVFAIVMSQTGCSTVSHDKLFAHVNHVRTNFEVKIEFSNQVEQRCRQKYIDNNLRPPSNSIIFSACAILLPDSALPPGEKP